MAVLAMTTSTRGGLRTGCRVECRTAVVTVVESTLGAVTITSTRHLYVVTICTNGVERKETYCTDTHQSN